MKHFASPLTPCKIPGAGMVVRNSPGKNSIFRVPKFRKIIVWETSFKVPES